MNHHGVFHGFRDRMENIGVFLPLFNLLQKNRYKELPLFDLGMSVLLYVLENMLKNQGTTNEELVRFLQYVCRDKLGQSLSTKEADQLRGVLVDEFLRNNGEPFVFSYVDMESNQQREYAFHLLEYDDYTVQELQENRIRLRLTEEGVGLLFKSKEFFNELQLSISQLMFRQQFEKGYFGEALQIIREMTLHISKDIDKTRTLQSKVMQNVLELSQQQVLEKHLERMNHQYKQEQRTFKDHKDLVKKVMTDYYEGKLTDKEAEGIHVIQQIDDRLLKVIRLHETMFAEKQKLQRVMSVSIERVLLNSFRTTINFEREIVEEVKLQPATLDVLTAILRPLFIPQAPNLLSPEYLLQEQKRIKRREEIEEEVAVLTEDQILEQEQKEREIRQKRERTQQNYLYHLLVPLIQYESYSISQVLEWIREKDAAYYDRMIHDFHFYSLLIDLHQSDYTAFEMIAEKDLAYLPTFSLHLQQLIKRKPEFLSVGFFSVIPSTRTIHLSSGYAIQNFTIQRGDYYGMAKK